MKKIEITKAYAEDNTIHYEVREDSGLGLLQQDKVDLFIRYHFGDGDGCDFSTLPFSVLVLPISLYLVPITYFYQVELVIPEMDKELFERLPQIYAAYSKVYGPFKEEWRGKITVKKVVENKFEGSAKYDKVVFFSGGVDACHAGINNPGKRTLLVSLPDIECKAKNEGPLRDEKFSLIKNFADAVSSDWWLIANNFNLCLFKDQQLNRDVGTYLGFVSPAYKFDGWYGIKYVPNMCCVAPIAYLSGIKSLIMGSGCETIDGKYAVNLDGAHPSITGAIAFEGMTFAEQEGLQVRRSVKVRNIVDWCKANEKKMKLWACFSDRSTQCGFCMKCVRTQLNILCVGENPAQWGFDDFSEKQFDRYIRSYRYREFNPAWLWDNIDSIEDARAYPYLDKMLHWLKKIGYKEYSRRAERAVRPSVIARLLRVWKYPHYAMVVLKRLIGRGECDEGEGA